MRGQQLCGRPLLDRVNPQIPIPDGARKVHGISDADVADAPLWPVVAARLKQHIDEVQPLLCGYNLHFFDAIIINAENARNEIPWSLPRALDPFLWAQWYYRGDPGHKLGQMCKRFGIILPEDQAHGAGADSIAAGLLLWAMLRSGLIPDDLERAFLFQGEILRRLNEERCRFGTFLFQDRKTGVLRIGAGKQRGLLLKAADLGYLQWILRLQNIPDELRSLLKEEQTRRSKRRF